MSQEKYSKKTRKKKHLNEKDRYQIEALLKAKKKAKEIAEIFRLFFVWRKHSELIVKGVTFLWQKLL